MQLKEKSDKEVTTIEKRQWISKINFDQKITFKEFL